MYYCVVYTTSFTGVLGKLLDSARRKADAERGKKRRIQLVISKVSC